MKCSLGRSSAENLMNIDNDLIDGRSIRALLLEHRVDELFELLGVNRLRWNAVLNVEDGEWSTTVLLEWCRVVAQFIKQDTKGPNVGFLVDDTALIDVDHLRGAVLQRSVFVEVGFHAFDLVHTFCWFARKDGCSRTKVTELECSLEV